MADVFGTEEKRTVKLADGKEYALPILNLNTLANIEKTLGFGLNKLEEKTDEEPATVLRAVIHALLKEKNPKLTLTQAGELITVEVMHELKDIVSALLTV